MPTTTRGRSGTSEASLTKVAISPPRRCPAWAVRSQTSRSSQAKRADAAVLSIGPLPRLPLLRWVGLGRVGGGVVLPLRLGGIDERQVFLRGGDVVPGAVLEIDQGLVVAIDRDDATDDAGEAFQFGAVGIDAHEPVNPPLLQLLVALVRWVHKQASRSGVVRSLGGEVVLTASQANGQCPAAFAVCRLCGRLSRVSTSFHTVFTARTRDGARKRMHNPAHPWTRGSLRMLDAVILSDLHLGSDNCQARQLCELLEGIADGSPLTASIILNGDVFDSIDFRRLKKTHWKVLSLIRKLSDRLEIVWICGNHDGSAEIVSHLLGVRVVDEYVLTSGGRRRRQFHGHISADFLANHT